MGNVYVEDWVKSVESLCQPRQIHWCDGSDKEREALTEEAVKQGIFLPLNQEAHPGSYLHRSDPNDVARVEHLTFICTPTKEEAGSTNHWMDPVEAHEKLKGLFRGSMKDRTLYVIPYVMGPLNSKHSKIGIQITDSIYVVLNMGIMTRMGKDAMSMLGNEDTFNKGLHCTGDLNAERRYICHFPQENSIISFGSGYGGNALLGKKCLALRIGSYLGRNEGWLAEHMLILGLESPEGQMTYIAAAFPSACGKTNLAMLLPPKSFKGWRVHTVGDDIAWLRVGSDGRLWAVNPENGYFGVAPGTNWSTNPNAMRSVAKDSVFTNVALTSDGRVWWEGMDGDTPENLTDWRGRPWKKGSTEKAAHPNSRFTAPARNNPMLSPHVNDPEGVPISAIIFGGRRSDTVPLVMESFSWAHGVYFGATMASEKTAAAEGQGAVRRDPMAMLPFCGYNMAQYFGHWLKMQKNIPQPPKIFMVNWFRKGKDGNYLWPGYGENMRVLKWIADRAHGQVGAQETMFGWVPKQGDIDLSELALEAETFNEATAISEDEWKKELEDHKVFFDSFGSELPSTLEHIRQSMLSRLS